MAARFIFKRRLIARANTHDCILPLFIRSIAIWVAISLLFISSSRLAAQQTSQKGPDPYSVESFNESNGLLSNEITKVHIGRTHLMWFGHYNGISCYNGNTFQTYPLPENLNTGAVWDISEDEDGHLLICTDRAIFGFTGIQSHPFYKIVGFNKGFEAACLLPFDKNSLLIGGNTGVYVLDSKGVHKYSDISDAVLFFKKDASGFIYAFGKHVVYVMHHGKLIGSLPHGTLPQRKHGICADIAGGVWQLSDHKAYYLYNGIIADSMALPDDAGIHNSCFLHAAVSGKYYLSQNNNLWLGNGNGHWSKVQVSQSEQILEIKEDVAGNLWVVICYSGVIKLEIPVINQSTNMPAIVLISHGGGKIAISGNTAKYPLPSLLRNKKVYKHLLFENDSSHWYYTEEGLYMKHADKPLTFIGPGYRFSTTDHAGGTWLYHDGIALEYRNGQGIKILSSQYWRPWDYIRDILVDAHDHALFVTETALLQWTGRSFIKIMNVPANYRNRDIFSEDRYGHIFICSNSTIYKMAVNGARPIVIDSLVLSFRTKPIIPYNIAFDYHNNLWLVSPEAIIVLFYDKTGYYSWSNKAFIKNSRGAFMNSVIAGTGHTMCFIRLNGEKCFIDADTFLKPYITAPFIKPSISTIELLHEHADWLKFKFLTDEAGLPVNPVFQYDQNALTFHFSAVSPFYPEYIIYQYKLDGMDTAWQHTTRTGSVDYNSLPPGHYTLQLRASDARDHWVESAPWSFTILKPWWKRFWACILWCGLAVSGIAGLFYWRLRALRKHDAMENLVTEHQLKAFRAQINPHFLQNTFDFLGFRVRTDTKEGVLSALHQVSAYMRSVLYRSNKIILSLEEEIELVREFWDMQQMLLQDCFKFEILIDPKADTFGIEVPALLLQPIAENAVKYGIDRTPGAQSIMRLHVLDDVLFVYCNISDCGSNEGIPAQQTDYQSFGRALTMQRMQLLYRKHKNKPFMREKHNDEGGLTVTLAIPKY